MFDTPMKRTLWFWVGWLIMLIGLIGYDVQGWYWYLAAGALYGLFANQLGFHALPEKEES